jgi:serine protease Do
LLGLKTCVRITIKMKIHNKLTKLILSMTLATLTIASVGCLVTFPDITISSEPQAQPPKLNERSSTIPIDPNWSPDIQIKNNQVLPSIADVVEKVFPSVVAINTETVALDFFSRPQTQKGAGSGWIIDKNGIIVTNNHVVVGAKKVIVQMFDGRSFQVGPEKVYRDPITDLAVIKLDAANLPAAITGDSSTLRVGEWVVALGNPLGNGLRAKEGTISGLKVSLLVEQGQTLDDLIETSAAINPGNSGGPMVNLAGQVIGITSAKMAAIGVEGMGYAISIKAAMPIIEELIKSGFVVRPYVGIAYITVDQYLAAMYRLSATSGVVIANITPGGPAEVAGLKKYDVITQYNGKEITTAEGMSKEIYSSKVGEEVKITYVRQAAGAKTVSVRLIQSPVPTNQ